MKLEDSMLSEIKRAILRDPTYMRQLVKVKVLVTQSCPTLCDAMNWSPPGSSAHEILQARILE